MTYQTVVEAAAAAEWGSRCQTALIKAAIAIAQDAPATELDARRDRLARDVLRQPEAYRDMFRVPVALQFIAKADLADGAVVSGGVIDAEIDSRVSAIWNDFLFPE